MRIQLEFSVEMVTELKELMEHAGVRTYNEFFNNSLTLTKWAIQEVDRGRIVGSFDEREEHLKELAMPFLHVVAKKRAPVRPPNEFDPPVPAGR